MSVIPVLGQEDQGFKVDLSYTEFKVNKEYMRLCLKNKTTTKCSFLLRITGNSWSPLCFLGTGLIRDVGNRRAHSYSRHWYAFALPSQKAQETAETQLCLTPINTRN